MNKNQLFRKIPKMDALLAQDAVQKMINMYGYDSVLNALRKEQEKLRLEIACCTDAEQVEEQIAELAVQVRKELESACCPQLKKVLNGTGTILHTNLGRAALPGELVSEAVSAVCGYTNLEYDLDRGTRGNRGEVLERLLCEITQAEAAVVVNNNAAAVLLVLNAVARDGEVLVSRGELVEIGGHFRIPDVMEMSGATLVEVGTTNKTRLCDYQQRLSENTKAVLKVHTSNYRIVGFTEAVSVESLCNLPVPIIEDLGSGALIDLKQYGLPGEPVVQEALKNGADIICFSGDKLLGGPQAGIIVGKKCYVEQMRNNPLYRTMRIDKLTAAILERILLEYRSESRAIQNIPVLRMITKKPMDVEQDAKRLKRMLKRAGLAVELELYPCESQVGGGSLPLTTLPSVAVAFMPYEISVEELDRRMRKLPLPVIGRIEKGKYLLDMRTFEMEEASRFIKELKEEDVLRRADL